MCRASISTGRSNAAWYDTASGVKHLEEFHMKDHQEFLLTNKKYSFVSLYT